MFFFQYFKSTDRLFRLVLLRTKQLRMKVLKEQQVSLGVTGE